jgi:hypothetical protein
MKRLLMVMFLLFALAFIAVPTATAFAYAEEAAPEAEQTVEDVIEGENDFDWSEWFKEKAMPVLIAVSAGVVTICSFLYPVLYAVNGGVKLFKKSKAEFDNVTTKVVETQNEIIEFKTTSLIRISEVADKMQSEVASIMKQSKEELDDIKAKNTAVLDEYGKKLAELTEQVENSVKIAKIGFCNSKELVKNGYANEIMKVGVGDDTQTETSDNSNGDI